MQTAFNPRQGEAGAEFRLGNEVGGEQFGARGLIATGSCGPRLTLPCTVSTPAREMLQIIDETENVAKYLQNY